MILLYIAFGIVLAYLILLAIPYSFVLVQEVALRIPEKVAMPILYGFTILLQIALVGGLIYGATKALHFISSH